MPLEMGSQKDRVPASCEHLGQLLRCKSRWGALCNSRRLLVGPSAEATDDLFRHYTSDIKIAPCPDRKIGVSRNIGVEMASARQTDAFLREMEDGG